MSRSIRNPDLRCLRRPHRPAPALPLRHYRARSSSVGTERRLYTLASMRILAAPSLMCLATLASGTRAFGQDRDLAAAEALFREARAAMQSGDFDAACAKFEESERLDKAPGTVLNLAECEEKRGRVATAWGHLRRAVDMLP